MTPTMWKRYEAAQNAVVLASTSNLGVVEYDNLLVNPLVVKTGRTWSAGTVRRAE